MNRSAPKELNYSDTVPLAIPSSSNRREFTPNNGQVFTPNNANVIRIDINSDNYLDTAHSYLQATLTNLTPSAANGGAVNLNYLATDVGPSWIQSIRIESGGVTLEHITAYNKLYAFLQLSQSSIVKNATEYAVMMNDSGASSAEIPYGYNTSLAWQGGVIQEPHYNMNKYDQTTPSSTIKHNASYTYTIPLMSALFNSAKYLPLILVNAGLTIEITIAPGHEVGVCGDNIKPSDLDPFDTQLNKYYAVDYSITEVKYVAHLIDLDRSFNQVLRDNMSSAGAITLHGTVWRHFQSTFSGTQINPTINIPARMKSIKSIFSVFRDQSLVDGTGKPSKFTTGVSTQSRISGWQYKVGSVSYPQAPVKISSEGALKAWYHTTGTPALTDTAVPPTGIGPTYCEFLKAFGALGTTETHTCLGPNTYGCTGELNPRPGELVKMFVIGYDVESFSKTVIESGIDTASRALPISLELSRHNASTDPIKQIVNDNFVCGDGFFYFNPDGTITPSV
jgi:hypothetical protein